MKFRYDDSNDVKDINRKLNLRLDRTQVEE